MKIYNFEKLPSPWLYWKYTFLRPHINELLKDESRLIYTWWKKTTLEKFFFYPDMPYVPLRIQPTDRTGSASCTETSLGELLMQEDGPRFIFLQGDGGAGKTTLLLRTALDCIHQQGKLNKRSFVPAFIDLRSLKPPITEDRFYKLIAAQTVVGSAFNTDDCKRALKYTDNALLIFDGLNEVLPEVRTRIDELSVAFNNFIDELPRSDRVIVACRESNLLDLLDGNRRRFQRFMVRAITIEDISLYLERVLGSDKAKKMRQALGNQIGLLENPMLLQLFSMISPEQVESRLNRALIYRHAIQNWIKEQSKRGMFPHFAAPGCDSVHSIYQLLQRLAVKMVELGKGQLSEDEAKSVIKSCQDEDWYPVYVSGKPVDRRVIYEEVFKSGLLRLVR